MTFILQLLHASDFEGGIDAAGTSPQTSDAVRFSAVLNRLRTNTDTNTFGISSTVLANTLTLSSGDNYIPSPFLNASSDTSLNNIGGLGSSSAPAIGRGDIGIINAFGIQASVLGNHEFDLGVRQVRDLIRTGSGNPGTKFPYLSTNLDFIGEISSSSNPDGALGASDLATNQDTAEYNTITGKIAKSTVITLPGNDGIAGNIDDQKIGIIGVTTPLLPSLSSIGKIVVSPSNPTDYNALATNIQDQVDKLTAAGINKVILLAHMQQYDIEVNQLAPRLKNVDIIVAGGSHSVFADNNDPLRNNDSAAEVYPVLRTSATNEPVLVVNTGANYRYVGRLVTTFDDTGIIDTNSLDTTINGAYATDQAGIDRVYGVSNFDAAGNITAFTNAGANTEHQKIVSITNGIRNVISSKDNLIVGKASVFLNGTRTDVRTRETNFGNLTADANLWQAKQIDPTVVISLKNGGGIRDNIGVITAAAGATSASEVEKLPTQPNSLSPNKQVGDISQLDVENSLRFNNSLSLITVTAQQLKWLLENGVANVAPGRTPGAFPQVGGLTISYDATKKAIAFDNNGNVTTEGERIRSLTVVKEDGTPLDVVVENGVIVGDPNRTFRMVTLNFLAGTAISSTTPGIGGDGYIFPKFVQDNPALANRVDLRGETSDVNGNGVIDAPVTLADGVFTFAAAGTEQDAFAEYMNTFYSNTDYNINDIGFRADFVRTINLVNVPTYIHDVQGSGDTSPLSSQNVTIEGVVIADFQLNNQLRGFFIQEEDTDQDENSATSEGIFVFTGSNPPLNVQEGQIVRVTGNVSEFFNMTQITATTAGSITLVNGGNNLSLVTPTIIDLPTTGDINTFYEQSEGMLVQFADQMYVSEYFELARYGQIVLTADGRPYQYSHIDNTPTAAEYTAFLDDLNRKRIILDDDDNTQNSPLNDGAGKFFYPQPNGFGTGTQGTNYFRGGDSISNLTGVLHWSFAGQSGTDAWRIRPTQANPIAFTVENPRPTTPPNVGGNIKVASFNVLNYFNTIDTVGGDGSPRGADSVDEFDRQNEKLIAALIGLNADVVGLMEIENNGDTGTPAVKELVDRLNAQLGANTYDYINTGKVGTDQITVALIYKKSVLEAKGAAAILIDAAFTDPNNTGQQRSRPAIAQTFRVIDSNNADFGASFNVVVNHLKSKGADGATGADSDQLDGQGAWNDTRTKAASYLVNTWIPSDPTGQGDPDFLIIGDLNAYKGETPITAIKNAGYTDLVESYGGNNAYGYVFNGQLGYLDHALANASLASQVTGVAEWHINADEVPVFDYNNSIDDGAGEASFEAKPTGNNLYESNPFRTSDHDPVIIGLNLNSILPDNNAPIDLTLSTTSVNENVPDNAEIGIFNTIDPDQDDTFTYTLIDETPVDGVNGQDNSFFTISGNKLIIKKSPDFETKSSYNIGVRTTDKNGAYYTKGFVININDIAPQLLNSKNDVFNITGETTTVKLKIKISGRNSNLVNELGVFTVDDENSTINGIAPGAVGYTEAALARSQVIFSVIANNPNGFDPTTISRLLEFDSHQNFRFYLIKNSTFDRVKQSSNTNDILFATATNQKITSLTAGSFALGWKDGSNNTTEFNDLVVNIKVTESDSVLGTSLQGKQAAEVIDLQGLTGNVSATFTVNREAAYDNFVGFYRVTGKSGGIDINNDGVADLLPGQNGYIQAAINQRLAGINLTVNNQATANYASTFSGGGIFAPFIIANGRPEALLDTNTSNDPAVYFPYLGANPNQVDHIRLLGDNVFGFEDLPGGGDADYNDMIVRINLTTIG